MFKLALPWWSKNRVPADPWSLDRPLLRLSGRDDHRIRDAVNGVVITGMSGSGKTSALAEAFALAHLRAGFGGGFHAVKPEDPETALRWCRRAGREKDVVLFGAGHPARFNFLDAELNRPGAGAGLTENLVDTVLNVAEIRNQKSGGGGGGGGEHGQYFVNASRQLLRSAVDVLARATGRVSVPDVHRLVTTAPTSLQQFHDPRWRAESFFFKCLAEASHRAGEDGNGDPFRSDLDLAGAFWCEEFPQLSDRTRSSVVSSVTGTLDSLVRGHVRELVCTTTTFTPAQLFDGAVLVHTMPALEYGEVGAMVQVIVKYAVQKAIERRDVRVHPRPVFLHADEFQSLITSADAKFALTCRSARGALLLLTQTLPTVYAALGGGDLAKQEVSSLLANLNLRVFCANSDPDTCEWASAMVGKTRQFTVSLSRQRGGPPTGGWGRGQTTSGLNETTDHELQPAALSKLRTGGTANRRCVDAILFRTGSPFRSSGRNWTRATFKQQDG